MAKISVGYKGLQILYPYPSDDYNQFLNNNFKFIADQYEDLLSVYSNIELLNSKTLESSGGTVTITELINGWNIEVDTSSISGAGFTPIEGEGINITPSGVNYIFSVDDYISATEVANISGNLQYQIDNISISGSGFIPLEGDGIIIIPIGDDYIFSVDDYISAT